MSKYKEGDKIVLEIISGEAYGDYLAGSKEQNWWFNAEGLERGSEPLSTYTEPLERKNENKQKQIEKLVDKLHRQAAEITRLLEENKEIKEDKAVLNAKIDAYELYGDQHEEEYNQAFNQGAEAAWELARKIAVIPKDGGYGGSKLIEIFNTALNNEIFNLTYPEAAAKVAEWEKAKEEIKAGDVYMNQVGNYFVIYGVDREKDIAKILWSDLSISAIKLDDIKEYYIKTGRHIDIDGFLKQIGEK